MHPTPNGTLGSTAQTYHLTTPNTPLSPKICRDTLTLLLTATGRAGLVDTARALVSEVVTNAVTHTVSPTIGMEARVLADGGVRVCVYDDCRAELLAALDVSRDSEHGRGLFLVQALAHEWGTAPAPRQVRAGGEGKHVWFEVRAEGRDRTGDGIYRFPTIMDT